MAGYGIFILTALVSWSLFIMIGNFSKTLSCAVKGWSLNPGVYVSIVRRTSWDLWWTFNVCGCDWPKICRVYFPVREKIKSCDVNSGPKAVSHHLWSPWTTVMGFHVIVWLCAHNASSAVPRSRQATFCYQEQDRLNWSMQIVVYGAMLQCLPTFAGHIWLCLFLTSCSL